MPAKRHYEAEQVEARLEELREKARLSTARWRARRFALEPERVVRPHGEAGLATPVSRPPRRPPVPRVCILCGFPLVDEHHIWGRAAGEGPDNLTLVCPNHHRMVHLGLLSILAHAAIGLAPLWPLLVESTDHAGQTGVDDRRIGRAPGAAP